MLFRDRTDAGRQLARKLARLRDEDPIVLALPRGGVPVAYEIAAELGAPLDVWVARPLGVPGQPEIGIGAIAEDGEVFVEPRSLEDEGVTPDQLRDLAGAALHEVERCVRRLRGDRPRPALLGRTVIVVDDGIATGAALRAAIAGIRRHHPARLVLAVPVAATEALQRLRGEVDELVCLASSPHLRSVGELYVDFSLVGDRQVRRLLDAALRAPSAPPPPVRRRPSAEPPPVVEREVRIPAGGVELAGTLAIPSRAAALVLFAHGSGSNRRSPRHRVVAEALWRAGVATLLFDLLREEEEAADQSRGRLRFDVDLLAERLVGVTDWVRREPGLRSLPIGYFGAGVGAAAALDAVVRRPRAVRAVVCRGGRVDLALRSLARVKAPTLLVVGGADRDAVAANEEAVQLLRSAPKRLVVVPGAGHLFEEPGALEEVTGLAADWFVRHLVGGEQGDERDASRRSA